MVKFSKAHRLALSKAAKARHAVKRGVKPGIKRGNYKTAKQIKKRIMTLDDYATKILKPLADKYTPSPMLTLCGQLEDAILLLETRISNSIAKINSLM